jgi:hypothetical protein
MLIFLIQQSDGTFVDQTSTYLIGSNDLGGCSSGQPVVADLNNDGYLDIAYAINQEDGRDQTNPSDMIAQLAAVVSVGSKYTITKFGPQDWYEKVQLLTDSSGNNLVTANGTYNAHSIKYAYGFNSDGTAYQSTMQLPFISPTSGEFLSVGTSTESTILIQPADLTTNYMTVAAFIKNNGIWTQMNNLTLYPTVGSVSGTSYTNDTFTGQPVVNVNGNYVTAALSHSCKLKLTPTSQPLVLFNVTGSLINNFSNGMTVTQVDMPIYNGFVGVTVSNNQLVSVPVNIPTDNVDFNVMECKDVNGDGYDDVVIYSMTNNGLPLVYLNDHNSNFVLVNQNEFPTDTTQQTGNLYSSLLHDFNNDGIMDLLVVPVDYSNSTTVAYKFYWGNKVLTN